MNVYLVLKHAHLSFVALSIGLMWYRMGLRWLQPVKLNQMRWLRWLPHLIDTLLLSSALGLCWLLQQWPGQSAWLTAKVIALLVYIVLSSLAYKRLQTKSSQLVCFVLGQAVVLYLIGVAIHKTPSAWF
ncbi:SirB2 family protein [Aquaspirillum serpens]|uniref:SirB2 family protein n=1 Tax=Aquaspirillum serpens TaxID=190 RepID=UPI0003B3C483|nr:SirB2 family protein [Aquaspirillum serpens]